MSKKLVLALAMPFVTVLSGRTGPESHETIALADEAPEHFLLRPEVEKAFGHTHAIKISGAVSIDDEGNPTAAGIAPC